MAARAPTSGATGVSQAAPDGPDAERRPEAGRQPEPERRPGQELPPRRHRSLWPAPTIRLRLTALYGIVFLITGAALLTIGYLLVRNGLRSHHQLNTVLARLGHKPTSSDRILSQALSLPPGSP
jgi:hypothetical protein